MTGVDPLDLPARSALYGRHAGFAVVCGGARRYHPEVGVFATIDGDAPEVLADLAALVAAHGDVAFLEAAVPPIGPGLRIVSQDLGVQMVCAELRPGTLSDVPIRPLGDRDAGAMLALATLTEPGPFFARTHQLGDFVGIEQDGRLLAMAGERMKPDGGTEISGVCTHPEARGRGYARALISAVATRILARGEVPFLHAYASNEGAIALYRALGFVLRREVQMTRLGLEEVR
jgi:predicted GNAT family acetyltransferase